MGDQNKGSNYIVYLAVVAVNLISFSAGECFSWASPIIPKLSSSDPTINPLSKPITTFEQSWIVAIMNLGAVFGPPVGGLCSKKFGKKKTLLIIGVPMVISQVLCAFAVNVNFFLAARFLVGVGAGTVYGVVPGYLEDIAEDKNKGALGSVLGVMSCSGVLFMYLTGPFLSVQIISLINLLPLILFYALFGCCSPESPYDLVKQGNYEAAEQSLMTLRNKTSSDVKKELAYIIGAIEANGLTLDNNNLSFLRNRGIVKGLIISNSLMFFQQFSGMTAVISYLQTIFDSAGSTIPSIYSAMIVGLVQWVSNIASSQLIDKVGRKMLLITSFIFEILSLVSLGAYFYLKASGKNVDQISWLPIVSLIIKVSAYNLGLHNIPFVLSTELFPATIKNLASTITIFFLFFLTFLITMCFPYLNAAVGMAGTFWIFAAFLVIGCAFTIIFVPETKGKSSQEIANILEGVQK